MQNERELAMREEEPALSIDTSTGLEGAEKPRTVRLWRTSFQYELLDLYHSRESGPPDLSAKELDELDFNNRCGIAVVHEVLRNPPVEYVSYQRLSRCATKLAVQEMAGMDVFGALNKAWTDYGQAKRRHPQRVRKFFDDFIEVNSKGYQPFVKRANVHLWFWDDEIKHRAFKLLGDAQLPKSLFYAFVAHILTQLPGLEQAERDLSDEFKLGRAFARRLLVVIEYARQACDGW
jgi:hypothetical protein